MQSQDGLTYQKTNTGAFHRYDSEMICGEAGDINCESLFAVRYYVCLWAATGHLYVPAWNPRGRHCQMFGLISMAINTTLPQNSQLSNKAAFLENGVCIRQTQKASTFFKKSINDKI